MKQIIGAIHFPPMPGYKDYPGIDEALTNAMADLNAFETGGATAILIENNYDVPHKEKVSKEVQQTMVELGKRLVKRSRLPFGVSVLWNDYESAFSIAKEIGAIFIRVPVFVDSVETSYGVMKAHPENVIEAKHRLGAEHIKIYADIHVKHAKMISRLSITESAQEAIKQGADALIVTGKWTGDAPDTTKLKRVREVVGDFPILCGSGVDERNIKELFTYADGAIVSTSLKEDSKEDHEANVKSYGSRICEDKVRNLVSALKT